MIKSARTKFRQSSSIKEVRFIPLWYEKKPFRYRWKQMVRAINLTYAKRQKEALSRKIERWLK